MTTNRWPENETLQQLLADRATEGLDTESQAQLDELIDASAPFDTDAFDVAAAAVELALMPAADESMPEALRQTLETDADEFAGLKTLVSTSAVTVGDPRPVDVIGRLGWLAAAAAIVIAAISWMPEADPSAESRRSDLLASATDVIRADWKALETEQFAGIQGDVVWSTARQEGYMRIAGIPANDPTMKQYQLWIVDPSRDTEPIDGGVFDVPADGEVIVPIDAKLRADKPVAFALTLEKPGGVVEHDPADGPLLVIAEVK